MTDIDWKQFERLVAAIHRSESDGAEVKWNDVIDGRQFDVTVRFKYGIYNYLTVIECKNYSSNVPVEKIDALATKYRDVKANKAVMVSANGFQSGCINVAEKHGIRLLTLNESVNMDMDGLIKEVSPALNIYSVKFILEQGESEYELEDTGGRLAYLMTKTKLIISGTEKTPNEIIDQWQLTRPELYTDKENNIEIPFVNPVVAHIPYEESIKVVSLRFKCNLTEIITPNKPVMDNHIRAGLATKYELRDTDGNIEHSKKLVDLELGYDDKVEPGKFYVIPSLKNYYYCTSIDDGLVSWVLVESYQYGQLVRARLTQKEEYSGHYVQVEDKRILNRLRKILDEYNNYRR